MSSKRSLQPEDEPWLRYPDTLSKPGYQPPAYDHPRQDLEQQPIPLQQQSHHHHQHSFRTDMTPTAHKRSISKVTSSTGDSYGGFHQHQQRSFSPTTPRTLSEELSMALNSAENSYPSPITPTGLLSSPTDITSTSSSTSHFPLFKPRFESPSSSLANPPKSRPSPLSLYSNTKDGATSPYRVGSPTSAISHHSPSASHITASPRAASAAVAANLGHSSPLPRHHASLFSSGASSSSYSTTISSPTTSLPPPCSALCHHNHTSLSKDEHRHRSSHQRHHHSISVPSHRRHGSKQQHHPACQHHTHSLSSDPLPHLRSFHSSSSSGNNSGSNNTNSKYGRATKGVHRFGTPHFSPKGEDDVDEPISEPLTRNRSTSSGVYGIASYRNEDDGSYADEPPKKRQRSTATILLDAAFETVIFTGAVALSAYQLLTGRAKLGQGPGSNGHSKQSSFGSDVEVVADKAGDAGDPVNEKAVLTVDTTPANTPRTLRRNSSGTLGRSSRVGVYHKAKTPRSYRSRQGLVNSYHSRSPSSGMPIRPNTGTEDSDETFLRMEAQLNNLIAEGKRALSSRIEVWDEE